MATVSVGLSTELVVTGCGIGTALFACRRNDPWYKISDPADAAIRTPAAISQRFRWDRFGARGASKTTGGIWGCPFSGCPFPLTSFPGTPGPGAGLAISSTWDAKR